MVDLPNVDYDSEFKKSFKKLDKSVKIKVNKQVLKIINRPTIGKPMKHSRKGTRELIYPLLGYLINIILTRI